MRYLPKIRSDSHSIVLYLPSCKMRKAPVSIAQGRSTFFLWLPSLPLRYSAYLSFDLGTFTYSARCLFPNYWISKATFECEVAISRQKTTIAFIHTISEERCVLHTLPLPFSLRSAQMLSQFPASLAVR